jgi:acyl carrier protein phosphodiesterase
MSSAFQRNFVLTIREDVFEEVFFDVFFDLLLAEQWAKGKPDALPILIR